MSEELHRGKGSLIVNLGEAGERANGDTSKRRSAKYLLATGELWLLVKVGEEGRLRETSAALTVAH